VTDTSNPVPLGGAPVPASKQQIAYRAMRDRIVRGQYGPGTRLVIEAIARELDMSPVPVREAIRRLEAEGWVLYRRNEGAQVAPVNEGAWEQNVEVLALLEGAATAIAAGQLSAGDVAELRELNRQMEHAVQELDLVEYGRLNHEFHSRFYERCGNPVLQTLIEEVRERLDAIRVTMFPRVPTRARASVHEHGGLLDAIEAGMPADDVERLARDHKLHTVAAFRELHGKADEA
jgi:DNA-binding GntR family transcriptional regulator